MAVKLLDWDPNNKTFIEEFKDSFETTGFIRLCELWNKSEEKVVKDWYKLVEEWFYNSTEKEKYASKNKNKHGWVAKESSLVNPRRKKDWKECFEFDDLVNYDDTPEIFIPQLKKVIPLIHNKSLEIVRVFETILNCEKEYLVKLHDQMMNHHLRVCYYPASEQLENQLPCSEHKDYNSVTLIFSPDPHKKLQIKDREGNWHNIEYRDNSCVCQLGNQMQIWTQDYLVSAFHRVLFNSVDAFTTAYFINLPEDHLLDRLGPNPKKYKDQTVKEFSADFHRTKSKIRKETLKSGK